mgnify:CR=1 FL=1|jgi:hypothetical protein
MRDTLDEVLDRVFADAENYDGKVQELEVKLAELYNLATELDLTSTATAIMAAEHTLDSEMEDE